MSSYQVKTYPTNSPFRASIVDGSSIRIDASTRSLRMGTYTVLLKVTATVGHLNIVDIVTGTINVKSKITLQNVVIFLSDGTLQSSVVDNVRVRTGFEDDSYALSLKTPDPEFGVRDDGTLYCSTTLNVTDLASTSHAAAEKEFTVVAEKGGATTELAKYNILIIRNVYTTWLDENQEGAIANFDLKSDNFKISSSDLPENKFALVDNHISVSKLDFEIQKRYDFHLKVNVKSGNSVNKGANSAGETIVLTVMVKDTNDEPPTFIRREFYFNMISNSQGNTLIGIVTATDVDTVGRLYYKVREIQGLQLSGSEM